MRLMLSTLTGYNWSRTLTPGAFLTSITFLILSSSSPILPITFTRLAFRPSLVTTTQRQLGWSLDARISWSMVFRSTAGVVSPIWSSGTLDVSTVQKPGSGNSDATVNELPIELLTGDILAACTYVRPGDRVALELFQVTSCRRVCSSLLRAWVSCSRTCANSCAIGDMDLVTSSAMQFLSFTNLS